MVQPSAVGAAAVVAVVAVTSAPPDAASPADESSRPRTRPPARPRPSAPPPSPSSHRRAAVAWGRSSQSRPDGTLKNAPTSPSRPTSGRSDDRAENGRWAPPERGPSCERRGWDSNPRWLLHHTSLAGRPDRPDSGTSPGAGENPTGSAGAPPKPIAQASGRAAQRVVVGVGEGLRELLHPQRRVLVVRPRVRRR